MRAVLFDFDRTLTKRDTILPLGLALVQTKVHRAGYLFSFLRTFAMLKTRHISNSHFKEAFVRLLLTGESVLKVQSIMGSFLDRQLAVNLRVPVFRRLRDHVSDGEDVYLVSSNYDFLLRSLSERWTLAGTIATETEIVDGVFTGRLSRPACYGVEKLRRVTEVIGEDRVRDAISYGDDPKGDQFLMAAVRERHWVEHHRCRL